SLSTKDQCTPAKTMMRSPPASVYTCSWTNWTGRRHEHRPSTTTLQEPRDSGSRVAAARIEAPVLSGLRLTTVRRLKHIVHEQTKTSAMPISEQAPLVAAATRVITGWYSDATFTDDEGRPLPSRPDSRRFRSLVQRYGNGFTAAT